MPTGNVVISVVDSNSAAVLVPGSNVCLVMGCSSTGTANQVVATQNSNTILSTFGYGPMPELAGLLCSVGATVLAIRTTQNAAGTADTVEFVGTGTSVVTATLDNTVGAYDDYLISVVITTGGTIATGPIGFQVSLDAGRNFGPVLQLGTATTYLIPNTGVTLNFAAGTLVTGDTIKFGTVAPAWAVGGVQTALQAFQASQYAITGVGTAILAGPVTGGNASTIQGYLNSLATGYIFNRLLINAVDAATPVAYGGAGQTDAAWVTAIEASYSAVSAKRIDAGAGFYNIPSVFANPVAATPTYRRPGQWAAAARQVVIPPQRHAGRVSDGALANIVVNPTTDPSDGFVYHDERLNPGLDAARFTSFWTRIGLPGFFVKNPNLMSPPGSTLTLLPLGNVLDVACDIVHQVGQQEIDSDIRVNPNGTIYNLDALGLEASFNAALQSQMLGTGMISAFTVSVDRTTNVLLTGVVVISVSITSRGYVLEEDVTIGFNQNA